MKLTKPTPSKQPTPPLLRFLEVRAQFFYKLFEAEGIYNAIFWVRQTLHTDYHVLLRALIIEEFAKHGKIVTRMSFDLPPLLPKPE